MRKFGASNWILLLLCLMYMILYIDRVNISTAAPLIKANLGLSNTQLGLAFSAFAYPYALFQLRLTRTRITLADQGVRRPWHLHEPR